MKKISGIGIGIGMGIGIDHHGIVPSQKMTKIVRLISIHELCVIRDGRYNKL